MFSSGCAGDTSPYLLKPRLVVLVGDHAEHASGQGWRAIAARLPLHQNEFDVVLDDRIGFVRLAEKTAAISICLIHCICDFVPDDRREIGEAQATAVLLDRSGPRNHRTHTP